MPPGIAPLSGTRKAAILLVTLGAEASAQILRQLSETEIEDLTVEISKVRHLPQDTVNAVLDEFVELAHSHSYILQGGFAYAREVLHKALGPGRADEVLGKVQIHFERQPFLSIHHADPKQLAVRYGATGLWLYRMANAQGRALPSHGRRSEAGRLLPAKCTPLTLRQ